jgi:hypothetical protein
MEEIRVPIGIRINNDFYSFHSDVWKSIVGKFREKSQWYTNGTEDVFCIEQPKGFTIGKTHRNNQISDYIETEDEINAVQVTNVCLNDGTYFEESDSGF